MITIRLHLHLVCLIIITLWIQLNSYVPKLLEGRPIIRPSRTSCREISTCKLFQPHLSFHRYRTKPIWSNKLFGLSSPASAYFAWNSKRIIQNHVDEIPTYYNPLQLDSYFNKRPIVVFNRLWQVFSSSAGFISTILKDFMSGNKIDFDVRQASELRDTIVSLGPFFIKLGQSLSIRPDILSPRAMLELQQLCDKVPSFDNNEAMDIIEHEIGCNPNIIFSNISSEPIAAASLGQVYKAVLRETGDEVALKVQRPNVLEQVSLDLYIARKFGQLLRYFPIISSRIDIVALLDEFAPNFYQELDYQNECRNGCKMANDMSNISMVVIPKTYPEYTTRKIHTAQWVYGEKLSQCKTNVTGLVNLGITTYLTQLLDTGFFHADPHPGNMLRTPDGKLVILDFGLMTNITDDQKYGIIETVAHLIHRDYDEIGKDFVKLGFIPMGVDTRPIVPAIERVFSIALSRGSGKSIDFQKLVSDLAEIAFKFPFRIPSYFALIVRAISVLEGIALVGNPRFSIVDEAYPYIAKRLMTDPSPRLRAALKYILYGRSDVLDADRLIELLQAFEKSTIISMVSNDANDRKQESKLLESVGFFFSEEGNGFREFFLDDIANGLDAVSRDALRSLISRLKLPRVLLLPIRPIIDVIAPRLSHKDYRIIESISKLTAYALNEGGSISASKKFNSKEKSNLEVLSNLFIEKLKRKEFRKRIYRLLPTIRRHAPRIGAYVSVIATKIAKKTFSRAVDAYANAIFDDGEQ